MNPVSKAHGVNMGPTWGRKDPGGPHVGHMNFIIWEPHCDISNWNSIEFEYIYTYIYSIEFHLDVSQWNSIEYIYIYINQCHVEFILGNI